MSETGRPDIETAKAAMSTRFGGKKELKKLDEHLYPDETVRRMATGQYGGGVGLVVMTDRRVLFVREGMVGSKFEDFPLAQVSSVQWASGMTGGKMTIFASGNKAEIQNMNKNDGRALADDLRARIAGAHEPAAAPAVAAPPPPPPPSVPAGWYPDPHGQALQRYWDGAAWTEHTAPAAP
jgi:hypothetical protein